MRIPWTAALGAAVVMSAGVAVATQTRGTQTSEQHLLMKSALFTWESVPEQPTEQGGRRGVFAAPTATLDELEYHTTMLKPGASPHAPHTHKNEELIIVKEGAVEAYVNGEWKPAPHPPAGPRRRRHSRRVRSACHLAWLPSLPKIDDWSYLCVV